MKLFIFPNTSSQRYIDASLKCIRLLEEKCGAFCVLSPENSELLFGNDGYAVHTPDECDLVVSIGGDGCVLKAACIAVLYDKPLVGINSGRLGYLCALDISALENADENVFAPLLPAERTLLSFYLNGEHHFALNDVVFGKEYFGETVDLAVQCNGRQLASCRADGVIVSTPTGSTSYNLSAGGPILLPDSPCFVITPICPHFSDIHPYVVPDTAELTVCVAGRSEQAIVYADGIMLGKIHDRLMLTRNSRSLKLLVRDESANRAAE
ncbi:MAG: NAD(+)/NADH kinase [Clostridia bacterium]|nr:NAD(+)/NADH kinase [Clostridia bacterium]